MKGVIWVTCDKHPKPDEACQRCVTCLDMNTRQAAELGLRPEQLDIWQRKAGRHV